jgi:hypothetical protein
MKKSFKISYWLLGSAMISVFLHNLISFLIKKEEGFFFALTFILLLTFIFSLFYNLLYSLGKKKK